MAGVPYVFGNATTSIPLTNLDANFNTGLTIGNTTVGLGNTVTTLGNVTIANATTISAAGNVFLATSSGNVGIGTSSPAVKLDVIGRTIIRSTSDPYGLGLAYASGGSQYYYIGTSSNTSPDLVFTNAGVAERMRLTDSGNLLVGTTTVSAKLCVSQSTGVSVINANSSGGTYSGTLFYGTTIASASSSFDMIGCYANSVAQFRVSGAGVIYAQNIVIQSLSDARLKENIIESKDGLDVINALRPVRFDWKAGYGNNRKNQLGFIAQEIETVFPDAVDSQSKVIANDDTVYKTVGPTALIPVLVKAIQEQQALITNLTTRLTTLEGK